MIGHMADAAFLELPPRADKPRVSGLTHVIDKGIGPAATDDVLSSAADHVDVWKFGWGTSYVDRRLRDKLALLHGHDVCSCLGGTLLEVAWAQGQADACLAWAAEVGFRAVEVSRGVAAMTVPEKHALIRRATRRFTVLSEVGRKDSREELSEQEWSDEFAGDREAGATWVIAEGRESGTVGLYRSDGSVREDIVAAVVKAVDVGAVLFEAPRRDQQAWFIGEFGPDVNLANVAPDEAIALETLRLGLRADTFGLGRAWQPARA